MRKTMECRGNSVCAGRDHAATVDHGRAQVQDFLSDVTPLLMDERTMMICKVQHHRSFLILCGACRTTAQAGATVLVNAGAGIVGV